MAKSKLTPQLTKQFAEAISKGYTYNQACDLLHIGNATFHEWVARGEGTHERPQTQAHADFAEAVKEAKAKRENRWQGVIEEAAIGGTWQAAAWLLERTNRKDFGRHESVEMTGKDGGPVEQRITGDKQREQVTALIDELAARRAGKEAA
jgi:hypothetical protein